VHSCMLTTYCDCNSCKPTSHGSAVALASLVRAILVSYLTLVAYRFGVCVPANFLKLHIAVGEF
jgi:hypothetical protein